MVNLGVPTFVVTLNLGRHFCPDCWLPTRRAHVQAVQAGNTNTCIRTNINTRNDIHNTIGINNTIINIPLRTNTIIICINIDLTLIQTLIIPA